MTRRASLPGAEELFRSATQPTEPRPAEVAVPARGKDKDKMPRHEEKVTFYCTEADLTELERVRLALRTNHKLPSDRSRIVRAALAEVLDDFDTRGSGSMLVRRLRDLA